MDVLDEMTEAGLKMDAFTYAHAIEACCNAKNRVSREPRDTCSCPGQGKKSLWHSETCLVEEEYLAFDRDPTHLGSVMQEGPVAHFDQMKKAFIIDLDTHRIDPLGGQGVKTCLH